MTFFGIQMEGQPLFRSIPVNHSGPGLLAKILRDVELTRSELEELLA